MTIHFVPGLDFPSYRAEQTYCTYLIEAFAESGCTVRLYTPNPPHSPLETQYELHTTFPVTSVGSTRIPGLKALHYAVAVLLNDLTRGFPDAYYTQYAPIALWFILARQLRIISSRIIYDTAAFRSFRLGWIFDRIDDYCLRHADLVVPRTSAMAETIQHTLRIRPERFLPLHNAVNLRLFENMSSRRRSTRNSLNLRPSDIVIAYLGNLYLDSHFKGKGIHSLIEAVAPLLEQNANLHFLVVGAKPNEQQIFSTLPMKQTHVLPPHKHRQFVNFIASSDITVIPYPTSYHYDICVSESKLFEFLAAGKAIITTDRTATREILTNGKNALLTQPDAKSIQQAISSLVANPTLRTSLGTAAKGIASQHTFQQKAQQILSATAQMGRV